jgi:hypothetical protein
MIQVSKRGVPFIMKDGKKQYAPVAAFKKDAQGNLKRIVATNSVPVRIAPAVVRGRKPSKQPRKPRSNKGVARGPREATLYRMVFGTPKAPKAKAMIASPGGTTYKSKAAATRARKAKFLKNMAKNNANPFAALTSMRA